MSISFKTFLNYVPYVIENNNPILLRGRHGIGKSEIVTQIAKKRGLPLVQRRASQMTEGDLLGLPSTDGEVTRWNPPDWFKQACNEPVLLFFDEIDRGVLEVRQGIFEITDSHQLAGHKLHPGTIVFAAINGGIENSLYSVGEMDPAELDRYTVFDVEPTVEDWLKWASKNCNDLIVEFITNNPNHLEFNNNKELEQGKVYPSRRSWKRFNDCCSRGLFDNLNDIFDCRNSSSKRKNKKSIIISIYELANGYLGFEAACAFKEFLEKGVGITIADLLEGKLSKKKIEKISINQHNALIDRFIQKETINQKLTDSQLDNIIKYMYHIPPELCVRFFSEFGNNSNDIGTDNVGYIARSKVDDVPFVEYFNNIISDNEEDNSDK